MDHFLQRVIHHPELVDAPILYSFFTHNPTEWKATKEGAETDKDLLLKENTTPESDDELAQLDSIQIDAHGAMYSPAQNKKKGAMRRWFSNKREQWALQNKNLVLEEAPVEAKKFADMQTYADHLEVCVKILSEDFKQIISSSVKISNNMSNMGASFAQLWGEHELSNTSSSNLYQSLGQVWAHVSKRISNHVSFEERYVDCPMVDLVSDVAALQAALSKRKAAVYTYTKLTHQGRDLNKQLEKIKASNTMEAQQERYYKLEQDLRHCDVAIETNRNHCELVTSRLERDIERFRVEWHERMRCVLEIFHKEHVAFLQSQAKEFSTLLPSLAAVDSARSNLPSEGKVENTEINISYTSGVAKATIGRKENNGDRFIGDEIPLSVPSTVVEPPQPITEGIQTIELSASFSSDDGFAAIQTMGGEADNQATNNKPIMKSV